MKISREDNKASKQQVKLEKLERKEQMRQEKLQRKLQKQTEAQKLKKMTLYYHQLKQLRRKLLIQQSLQQNIM